MNTVTWLRNDAPEFRKLPKHKRLAGIDRENGTVYFSTGKDADEEETLFLACADDGVLCARCGGHWYFPFDWLAQQRPDAREELERAATDLRYIDRTLMDKGKQ